jgi:hypothetical protein
LEEKTAEGYSYTNTTGELIGIAYHEWVLVYRPRNGASAEELSESAGIDYLRPLQHNQRR